MAPKTNISWITPSETLLRLGLGGFGDVKWAWGGGWCLPVFFRITSSPGPCFDIQLLSDLTAPFSRPKNSSKTCAPQGASPVHSPSLLTFPGGAGTAALCAIVAFPALSHCIASEPSCGDLHPPPTLQACCWGKPVQGHSVLA